MLQTPLLHKTPFLQLLASEQSAQVRPGRDLHQDTSIARRHQLHYHRTNMVTFFSQLHPRNPLNNFKSSQSELLFASLGGILQIKFSLDPFCVVIMSSSHHDDSLRQLPILKLSSNYWNLSSIVVHI